MDDFNSLKGLRTTRSCSGRVIVGQEPKERGRFEIGEGNQGIGGSEWLETRQSTERLEVTA